MLTGTHITHPKLILEKHTTTWSNQWGSDDSTKLEEVRSILSSLIKTAGIHNNNSSVNKSQITDTRMRRASKEYKKKNKIGADISCFT